MPQTDHPPRETPLRGQDYLAVQASPEFQELRSRLRRFVFPMSALFLIWYFAYVLLGAFAHDFMAIKVWGNINIGLLIGLGQFVSTFVSPASTCGGQTVNSTRAPKPFAPSSKAVR